jgi:mono/diheme cytochrome c family protein
VAQKAQRAAGLKYTPTTLVFVSLFSWNTAALSDGTKIVEGEQIFQRLCGETCHGTDIYTGDATKTLEQKYKGSQPAALQERTNLTPEFIEIYVRGLEGMAPYRPTEIDDNQFQALVAYLMRNNP